ncbi:MAG TPA: GDSL-type esterase/lipase family protein [Candidatus Limnocylindria bacterium]|nr:GDSL-type esterase/lipase family protein [Candidatus Limnocylindria bacterium]
MRRTASLSAMFFATLLVLVVALPASAAPPTPTVYLALGDSLADGQGASDWDVTGYVPLFADYVAGTPHGDAKNLVNLGYGGETTTSFLAGAQYTSALAVIADPASDVRVVTLSLGGNDLLNLLYTDTPCATAPGSLECTMLVASVLQGVAANYVQLVTGLASALAVEDADPEDVYVLTLYNPFKGIGGPYETPIDFALLGADGALDCSALANRMNAGLNDITACTAAAAGWTVVDGYALFGDRAMELTNMAGGTFDFHPNDLGYAVLADGHRLAERAGD